MGFELIATEQELRSVAKRLEGEALLACDLEADSMHHYREKVCLVQISTPEETFIVDPLACPDLSVLAPVFADPSVCKIFHGADYDVRSLHRDFGIEINNLFDTMVACQFLGEPEVGLAALLRKRFGVELDKRFQQADWSRRPITAEMLDYAVKDTTLLIPLFRQLEEELRLKGRLDWVLEECELLSKVRVPERKDDPLYLKFKGASRMTPPTLAALDELLRLREAEAERRDVPPFKVLGNETIRLIAERKPEKPEDLQGIPGFSSKLAERYAKKVLSAVAAVRTLSPECYPMFPVFARPKRKPEQEERLKRLKKWREGKSTEIGIAPGLLANNSLLESVAENWTHQAPGKDIPGLKEWQKHLFREELELLKN